jgi:hypothetical protein
LRSQMLERFPAAKLVKGLVVLHPSFLGRVEVYRLTSLPDDRKIFLITPTPFQ